MPYDIYPAVDETNNFPPVIRAAIAASAEVTAAIDAAVGELPSGGSTARVRVVTGLEPRPDIDMVIWLGGSSRPANMLEGDVWFQGGGGPVAAPTITTNTFTSMIVGVAFNQAMSATGIGPITWSAVGLPDGLSLDTAGNLTGTPTTATSGSATLTATNEGGATDKVLSWSVSASATLPTISTSPAPPAGVVGAAYAWSPGRTGSTPMSWSVISGALPPGLSMNSSTGAVSGTPSAADNYAFTVEAVNSAGTDTEAFSIVITPAEADIYTVFGATAPAEPLSYSDAASGSWNSQMFYVPVAGPSLETASIVGARLYVPAGSTHIGRTWRAGVVRRVDAGAINGTTFGGQAQYDSNGTKTEGSLLIQGWNELDFSSEWPGVGNEEAFLIGVQIGDGTHYLHVASGMSIDPIFAPGANFVVAETAYRSWYRDDQYDTALWYGIDVKVRVPA